MHTPRFSAFATAVALSCALPIVLTVGALRVSAQNLSKRHVDVTVTEPQGRLVAGLERERFEVLENGVRRAITDFSDGGSPISLAIVSAAPLPSIGTLGPEDELIQTPSLAAALRRLNASKNLRKAILTTAAIDLQAIPSGVQALQIDPANLTKAVTELRNQYRLEFDSAASSSSVEVVLNPPAGLPRLELNWK